MATLAPPVPHKDSLRGEMAAVEAKYPGWHLWLSDQGRIWATNVHNPWSKGSGYTAFGTSMGNVVREIAWAEHEFSRAQYGAAA